MKQNLARLLSYLAYTSKNGWIEAAKFNGTHSQRFALTQAREYMSVVGAFCWLSNHGTDTIVAPLVYVAVANDHSEAQEIHRKVWSQGLVPFLIILLQDEVLVCDGFRYSAEDWSKKVKAFSWGKLRRNELPLLETQKLDSLSATKLRSSLFWRDHAIDVSGRVDQKLLESLEGLSWSLIQGAGVSVKLSATAANGLIGKLLYVFFLFDRGIISQDWLQKRGHKNIDLQDACSSWDNESLWRLIDDLDGIFNGSIFPLTVQDRSAINCSHIDLVRMVLKHGARATPGGSVQLSFLDVDLGVLRVETLSAIYEQFLENVKSGERRRVGAYYTPPFLVDLVLDRVEEAVEFNDGVTVLDPSAGSGVFLVGAYRRILERVRATADVPMSLDKVRELLTRNIYGVERNVDACHVAAFSLYLTMLDYVNPRDLMRVAMGKDPKKLFPGLVGRNLFATDFFNKSLSSKLPEIRCVLGNPPWQTLKKLGSTQANRWLDNHKSTPIGNDQAAELFLWKALQEHVAVDGVLAMLIPAKSFINPTAARFRTRLSAEFSIFGAINFAHLRHKLFVGAKHACACIFVRNIKPSHNSSTWIYSPLSISQPVASREEVPWTLVMDKSDMQVFRQDYFINNSRSWFEAFMLRPVDRQIHHYINDAAKNEAISLLRPLLKSIGAEIKRGGNEQETGLQKKYLTSDDTKNVGCSRPAAGKNLELFQEAADDIKAQGRLPSAQLKKVAATYQFQFGGNILLVPRNFRDIRFIDYPKAYSSSYLGVFFNKPGDQVSAKEKNFGFPDFTVGRPDLRVVAEFLDSGFYCGR